MMEKICYLGIDVSKGYSDFVLLSGNYEVMEHEFQLPDTTTGRQLLKELIGRWQSAGLETLYCGVESTGGYENNWYSYLRSAFKNQGVYICRINPRGVKGLSDASLKRTITDAVSAQNIASYMICFPHKLDYGVNVLASPEGFKEGRQHQTCIRMQLKQKVQLRNQLEKLLYQYFPEILVYCRRGAPSWILRMLSKYPTAMQVVKSGAARLSAIKGITMDKAMVLIKKSKENMGNANAQTGRLIAMLSREILHKEELIDEERRYLSEQYRNSEEVVLLKSIPGVGIDSAVSIALEIEEVMRFGSSRQLGSFFGVHPTFKQSGDSTWGNHMSKAGRGEIRSVLYMVSLSASRCNPVLKETYARFRAKGMKHNQAIGVVMHKMLRIIYGILKHKRIFDAGVDEKNQHAASKKQESKEQAEKQIKKIKKERRQRFEPVASDAPISQRKNQKIKKQAASQTSPGSEYGLTTCSMQT